MPGGCNALDAGMAGAFGEGSFAPSEGYDSFGGFGTGLAEPPAQQGGCCGYGPGGYCGYSAPGAGAVDAAGSGWGEGAGGRPFEAMRWEGSSEAMGCTLPAGMSGDPGTGYQGHEALGSMQCGGGEALGRASGSSSPPGMEGFGMEGSFGMEGFSGDGMYSVTGGHANGIDAFITSNMLNKEAADVLVSLPPDVQDTVMKQFSPKSADPGSYEMNGKFIMFARSVERGQKGKGKVVEKGKAPGKVVGKDICGWSSAKGMSDSWGKGSSWDMGYGWDAGKGWGPDWSKGGKSVLFSLPPDVQLTVMEQFKGGDVGGVNGRFIVFARGVEKGRKGFGKGKGAFPSMGPPYGKGCNGGSSRFVPY